MRILVVEDRKDIQSYYIRGLNRAGVDFDIVDSRIEAIDMIDRKSYHGAIVDLQLTDDDSYSQGIEVLSYIRKTDEGTLAIVVSGTPHPQDIIDSYEGGAVRVVSKSEKNYPQIAEELVKECSNSQLRNFGDFPNLNSYLAYPDKTTVWEGALVSTLGSGYPKMQKLLRHAFKSQLPVLRTNDGSGSFVMNEQKKLATGKFWSKANGFAIQVAISADPSGDFTPDVGGPELDEIARKNPVPGYSVWVWRDAHADRSEFYKYVNELSGEHAGS